MKRALLLLSLTLLWLASAAAHAQDSGASPAGEMPTTPEAPAAAPTDPAAAPQAAAGDPLPPATEQPEKEKRSIYSKKVRGWLRIEGTISAARYNPGKFQSIGNIGLGDTSFSGPEYGGAVLLALGGFVLGPRIRIAKFDNFDLLTVGLDLGGSMRFIPYVHPYVRVGLNYNGLRNLPNNVTDAKGDGGGIDIGVGVRVPIIRWISFVASFNWSFIGLFVRDNQDLGEGLLGQQVSGMFGLTFHFIGVRKGD